MALARLAGLLARHRRRTRTIVAVPTIDRDAAFAPSCFRALRPILDDGAELLVLTREADRRARAAWAGLHPAARIETVPDYPVDGRHNHAALAAKRNRARERARERGVDALLFVDADVELKADTYPRLVDCLRGGADVAFAPYAVRWYANLPIVGIYDATTSRFSVERVAEGPGAVCGRAALGGLGCALIHARALDVPIVVRSLANPGSRAAAVGEDFGFFMACAEQGKRVCYLRQIVRHHLEPPLTSS